MAGSDLCEPVVQDAGLFSLQQRDALPVAVLIHVNVTAKGASNGGRRFKGVLEMSVKTVSYVVIAVQQMNQAAP